MINNTTNKLIKSALFVALMAIAAYIQIPFANVPMTLQAAMAVLAGLFLGKKWGAAAMLVYMAAGLLGLPVFAGFAGGFSYVFRPSFGFIAGFVVIAFIAGFASNASGGDIIM